MSRPRFEPTADERKMVEAMAGYGIPQDEIVLLIQRPHGKSGQLKPISEPTLRKYFAEELGTGAIKVKSKVAESLYLRAVDKKHPQGAACAMFLMKARFGWSERQVHEHTGKDGGPIGFELDLSDASPEELAVLERFIVKKMAAPRPANDAAAA